MEFAKSLVLYLEDIETGDIPAARSAIGPLRLRVVAIKLLSWMKSQCGRGRIRHLPLNSEFKWCADLRLLMNERGLFRETLEIRDSSIGFQDTLDDATQNAMCKWASDNYHPLLLK